MPVITLRFGLKTKTEALLLEEGAKDEKWPMICDARIKTLTADPVGPVVYQGVPVEKGDPVTRALFMFHDQNDAVACIVENADPMDLTLTIADFLDTYGASVSTMQENRPDVYEEQY